MSAMFINVPLYSDINSYKVLSVNGNKGLAVEVRKEPKNLEFSGYTCLNNREAYSNADPIEMGPTFEITKRGEEWYRKTHVGTFIPNVSSNKANTFNHEGVEVVVEKTDNPEFVNLFVYELTKTGKRKVHWEKLGKIVDYCAYYYDHNF